MYKTIFHLDQEEKIVDLIRNIGNLLEDIEKAGEEIEIEILANGSGVKPFKKDNADKKEEIDELLEKNVKIAICSNTLKKLELTKDDFIEKADMVASGVGELTRKQNNGWAYIKP